VSHCLGADSETGLLRTVLVHRPGAELRRITPRTKQRLLFDGLPWLARAQQEHDTFTGVLRDAGTEVLYVTELLQDVLEYACAREEAIASVLADSALGDELSTGVRRYLESLAPEPLAAVLIAGLTPGELRTGRGVVYQLLDPHDFVIDPLPNLVFSRDSSVWIKDQVIVTHLAGQRRRETELLAVIYRHHPRFRDLGQMYDAGLTLVDGGDVLLLAPGVTALGVGVRTTPAGVERLADHLLRTGLAHTVLAVPVNQRGLSGHLDTMCTFVEADTVMMAPSVAFTLTAHKITARDGELRVSRPQPFLGAAAAAMGIDRLRVIGTGLDPASGRPDQWDDGGNTLAIGDRTAVCGERNVQTNARLAAAGINVIAIPGSELGSGRGGPRCLCTPVHRDPAVLPNPAADADTSAPARVRTGERAPAAGLLSPAGSQAGQARRSEELTPAG
jgi:arginine deiminase